MALTSDEELYVKKMIQWQKLDAQIQSAEAVLKSTIQSKKNDLEAGTITVEQFDADIAAINATYESNNAVLWAKNALRYSEMIAARNAVVEE